MDDDSDFDPNLGKTGLRHELLAQRRALSAAQHTATGRALVDALLDGPPARVAAYASVGAEPDTGPLLARALADGWPEVLLPVLRPDGDLDWALHDGSVLPGPHGLLQPAGPRLGRDAVAGCDLVLVPALAVDRRGTRLGRGGGSYDRALGRVTGLIVAALHPGELLDRLPVESHDRPVDAVVLAGDGLVRLPHPGRRVRQAPGVIAP